MKEATLDDILDMDTIGGSPKHYQSAGASSESSTRLVKHRKHPLLKIRWNNSTLQKNPTTEPGIKLWISCLVGNEVAIEPNGRTTVSLTEIITRNQYLPKLLRETKKCSSLNNISKLYTLQS